MVNVLKSGKWSKKYPRCINCQTTAIPHKADGFCNRCYLWMYRITQMANKGRRGGRVMKYMQKRKSNANNKGRDRGHRNR